MKKEAEIIEKKVNEKGETKQAKTEEPEGEYEQIMEQAMGDDDYDQIAVGYTKCNSPAEQAQQLKVYYK